VTSLAKALESHPLRPRRVSPTLRGKTPCYEQLRGAVCGGERACSWTYEHPDFDGGPARVQAWHCTRCGATELVPIEARPDPFRLIAITPRGEEDVEKTPMRKQPTPGKCKSCGADILWVETPGGRSMPLDPRPEKRIVLGAKTGEAHVLDTYVSHQETCQSGEDRKGKAA
jgi:hypothetical protein